MNTEEINNFSGRESLIPYVGATVQPQGALSYFHDSPILNNLNRRSSQWFALIKFIIHATGIITIRGPMSQETETFRDRLRLSRLKCGAANTGDEQAR